MSTFLHKEKRSLLPYLGFSVAAGFFAAVVGIGFRLSAQWIMHLSGTVYGAVRQNLLLLPVLIIGAAALGLLAGFVVSRYQCCKGGGIPTSVAAVRGIAPLRWLPSILALPFSALLTFFCGIPLGTEGPCVQMGTAVGDGVIQCFGAKKHQFWRRYVMTGGASAGFSAATASPFSAILFSVEELQKKHSPLMLTGVSVCVVTAQITIQILALLGVRSGKLFHLTEINTLPAKLLFVPLAVGVVGGLVSVLFTRFYHRIGKTVRAVLKKLSVKGLFPILFACMSVVGVCLSDTLGTGHDLVDKLFGTHTAWYLLILVFLMRMVFMMVSNTAGVTGGVFLPTLAFGAVIGALCADGMIALGLLESQYYILTVILGITAFLGATSRIPLTACVFAVEALCGVKHIPALAIATAAAFLIAKLSGVKDITDAVIEEKQSEEKEVAVV